MKKKQIMTLILTSFMFAILFSRGFAEETTLFSHGNIGGALLYEVTALNEVQVDQILSVKFSFKAQKDLIIESITVHVLGAGVDYAKTLVVDASLDAGTWISETTAFTPASEGLVECRLVADYLYSKSGRWTYGYADMTFGITHVRNDTYEDLTEVYDALVEDNAVLQGSYDSLSSTHSSLQADHATLQNNYNTLSENNMILLSDLEAHRTAMYLFIVTTVIGVVAAIYFARKAF